MMLMNWEIKKNVKLDVNCHSWLSWIWIETYIQIDLENITQILKTADPIRNCKSITCIGNVTNKRSSVLYVQKLCILCTVRMY